MSKILKSQMCITVFVLWPLQRPFTPTNNFEWRMSNWCHYIFINILKSVQTVNFYELFKVFHSPSLSCTMFYLIRSTHSSNSLRCNLNSVHCSLLYLSFSFISFLAATATLQHTLAALRWSNNSPVEWFSTTVLRELLYMLQCDKQNSIAVCDV